MRGEVAVLDEFWGLGEYKMSFECWVGKRSTIVGQEVMGEGGGVYGSQGD